jgi:hypothetical protein
MARMLSGTKKGQIRKTSRKAYEPKRRKRRTSKKGLLSEAFDKKQATAGAKAVISGAVGGGVAIVIEKIVTSGATPMDKDKQALITGVAGFLTATILKYPNVGAGMGAIALYKYMDHAGFLADDITWADEMEMLPAVLNDGDDLYLQAQEEALYLQDNDLYLQDHNSASYDVGYYGMNFGG